jgi:hypothetical protein
MSYRFPPLLLKWTEAKYWSIGPPHVLSIDCSYSYFYSRTMISVSMVIDADFSMAIVFVAVNLHISH